MATLFRLPMLGQTMQEGTILKWLRAEGEKIESWETLLEVMTDKVNMEVDPQVSGVVRKILAPEGATLPVGAPLAIIGSPDEPIEALLAEAHGARQSLTTETQSGGPGTRAAGGGAGAAEGVPTEWAVGPGPGGEAGNGAAALSETDGSRQPPIPSCLQPSTSPVEPFPSVSPRAREAAAAAGIDWKTLAIPGTGYEGMIVERDIEAYLQQTEQPRPRMTPLAAKLAAELGVPPGSVAGTGPGGRVRAEDVRRHSAPSPAAACLPGVGAQPETIEIPLRGIRKTVADRLAESYRGAPHVPLRLDVEMTEATRFREQLLPEIERRWGVRVTYTDLIAAATAAVLVEIPALNATLELDLIRQYASVNLGIAVALEDGLIVPVIRNAERLSLGELAAQTKAMAEKARSGRLTGEELSGGTFTITNLGSYGIQSFDPILNPPQIGILGVGAIEERLVPRDGQPAVRRMMTLTLTFDHRAVDGAPAARFLARLRELLEKPYLILLNR